ncbi:MAG: phosphonate C-P lyase system protein PhnL [Rhodospirillaceae bacterium]|nr:phosphonate C-P lyase system protein PhnL [Rhodospirillaceae bacterium]
MNAAVTMHGVGKSFVMHLRDSQILPVLRDVSFTVGRGECVALVGPSGAGKSTLLRMIYGNYRCAAGSILIRDAGATVDIAAASPQTVLRLRQTAIGYVTQYLRVVPRVTTLDIVAEPLRARGIGRSDAERRARTMLQRVNLPERLWSLPPATFSGGEQQRVNVARGFAPGFPIMLLDEPTASLDAANRENVIRLILEARAAGAALLGIFHDRDVRDRVATRCVAMAPLEAGRE